MTRFHRARLRIRLTAASFLLSLLIVAGAVWALAAVLQAETAQTITARLTERAAALAATVTDHRGTIDVAGADDALFDGPNWVFDTGGTQIEGPTSNGSLAPLVARLATATSSRSLTEGRWHLLASPVSGRDGRIATVVTGVDDSPYALTLDSTLRAAVLLGSLAVLGATGLAALVLARSLGPIAVMTEQAAQWSRSENHRRFALGSPKDEIGQLAAVLDDLLDRVDAALSAERRLTAEIAHELRTPLTLLQGEADLALMNRNTPDAERARFERVHAAAGTMARAITALLADATALAERDAECDATSVARTLVQHLPGHVPVHIEGPATRLRVPSAVAERILAPVLDNGVRHASTRVVVRIGTQDRVGLIRVEDDGPGVDPSLADAVFTPGVSSRDGGTGLGLALARRLARDAGGEVALVEARPAVFEIRLPAVDVR